MLYRDRFKQVQHGTEWKAAHSTKGIDFIVHTMHCRTSRVRVQLTHFVDDENFDEEVKYYCPELFFRSQVAKEEPKLI